MIITSGLTKVKLKEDTKTHIVTMTVSYPNSHIIGTPEIGYAIVDLNSHKTPGNPKTINIFQD